MHVHRQRFGKTRSQVSVAFVQGPNAVYNIFGVCIRLTLDALDTVFKNAEYFSIVPAIGEDHDSHGR
jgi:hypothetical protein